MFIQMSLICGIRRKKYPKQGDYHMNEELLRALFKIPDPITVDEFARRTGKTESAVRKLVERRLIPLATEREVLGEEGSSRRLLILWN